MIKTNAILEFAEDLIHQKTETYCSELQRRILIAALQEERKTYDQLAEECGYSARYVKQDVAPKLWLLISQAVGEKVNKANVRAALEAAMRSRAPSQPQTQRPQHQVAQTPASSKTIKSISSFVKPDLSIAILAALAPITAEVSLEPSFIHLRSFMPVRS